MFAYPEATRLVAHGMLDVATATDDEASQEQNEAAVLVAVQRFDEIDDAYTVEVNDEGDDIEVTLHLSNMVAGAMLPMAHLIRQLAAARGVDDSVVISELREYIDAQV